MRVWFVVFKIINFKNNLFVYKNALHECKSDVTKGLKETFLSFTYFIPILLYHPKGGITNPGTNFNPGISYFGLVNQTTN